jgi:hypothetical protein
MRIAALIEPLTRSSRRCANGRITFGTSAPRSSSSRRRSSIQSTAAISRRSSFLIDRDGRLLGSVEGAAGWDGGPVEAMIRDRIASGEKKSAALDQTANPSP